MKLPGFTAEQALLPAVSNQTGRETSAHFSLATSETLSKNHRGVLPAMSFHCGGGECCVYFETHYCCSVNGGFVCGPYYSN